jgi:hypothetical protein
MVNPYRPEISSDAQTVDLHKPGAGDARGLPQVRHLDPHLSLSVQ